MAHGDLVSDVTEGVNQAPVHAAMVRVVSTNVPVYAYASGVRNDTGDATFIAGQ